MSGTKIAILAGAVMLTALTLVSATQAKQDCNDLPRGVINYSSCVQ
jgi:hypothetical protein